MAFLAGGREAPGNKLNGGATESGAGLFPGARMGERGKGVVKRTASLPFAPTKACRHALLLVEINLTLRPSEFGLNLRLVGCGRQFERPILALIQESFALSCFPLF